MDRSALETALQHLDDCAQKPDRDHQLAPDLQADLALIRAALGGGPDAAHNHYEFPILQALARSRQREGPAYQLPDDLLACPQCTEALLVVLEQLSPAQHPGSENVVRRSKSVLHEHHGILPLLSWRERLLAATAAAVLALAIGLLVLSPSRAPRQGRSGRSGPTQIVTGTFRTVSGKAITDGKLLPNGELLHAQGENLIRFGDGSELHVEADTALSCRVEPAGAIRIDLRTGAVVADVTPRDTKQPFVVKTALGRVQVVGTRFSVACDGDDVVLVNHQKDGRVLAEGTRILPRRMSVRVYEGVVKLLTAKDEIPLAAGDSATLDRTPKGILLDLRQP